MPDIELLKYSPINPVLKKLIKYYWLFRSKNEIVIHGKLIPMNNIDLIINLSTPIRYINSAVEETFRTSHFNGIQNNYRVIQQKGVLDIVGISFFPTGFYPLIKVPLSEFANKIVIIDNILQGFERKIERIAEIDSNRQRVYALEEILINYIEISLLPENKYDLVINDFLKHGDSININNYCKQHCISERTLERFFHKYAGTTPKKFLKTAKFQNIMKRLRSGDFESMTQIGYEFNYYDQTHFINSFKAFMDITPLKQLKQDDLIIDSLTKR